MTTDSAGALHTDPAPSQAAPRTATAIHPPRTPGGRRPVRLVRRNILGRGPAAALVAADATVLVLVLAQTPALPWPPAAIVLPVALQLTAYACRGLYRQSLSPSSLAELPALLGLSLIQWLVTAKALAAYDPRLATGWTTLLCAVLAQTLLGCAVRAAVHRARRRAAALRPQSALVVGHGPVAHQVTAVLYEHPEYGLRPVGRVEPGRPPAVDTAQPSPDSAPLPVLSTPEDVSRAVVQNTVCHAVFTQPPSTEPESAALVALFAQYGCRIWLIDAPSTTSFAPHGAVTSPDHLWGFGVQPLHRGLNRRAARAAKRTTDAVLAAVALLVAAPVMALCALAVRLSDGPGVLFRQERIGLDGRPFVLLKFRTLRPAGEEESATRWSVALDRRMSPVGKLLRRTSLDELPQLWNVVCGRMSLVGPRPERPYFVTKFTHAHPGYGARHRMPAGITGLAQVNGLRGDTSIEDRTRFDNRYIETWSLWQDLCILARTAASLFRPGGS